MGRKSCRVNMTFLLSFEEETQEARASALLGHCPFILLLFLDYSTLKMHLRQFMAEF